MKVDAKACIREKNGAQSQEGKRLCDVKTPFQGAVIWGCVHSLAHFGHDRLSTVLTACDHSPTEGKAVSGPSSPEWRRLRPEPTNPFSRPTGRYDSHAYLPMQLKRALKIKGTISLIARLVDLGISPHSGTALVP
jgi:hypothetical protein